MALCTICRKKSVHNKLCSAHFSEQFEKKVFDCIKRFKLIKKTDEVGVAASGGKDSTVLLHILSKKYKIHAFAVDEGIQGYRDKTLHNLTEFCKERNIPLQISSYSDKIGMTMDTLVKKHPSFKPCSYCGTFRRTLLNSIKGVDLIATGHNLDDEVQSFMMNLLKNQPFLIARQGPRSGIIQDEHFLPRIKPLYMCQEREIMAYCLIQKLPVEFNECPYAVQSFRAQVRDALNEWEMRESGVKMKLMERLLQMIPELQKKFKNDMTEVLECKQCGAPTTKEICQTCLLKRKLVQIK